MVVLGGYTPSLGSYSSICLGSYGGPRGVGHFFVSEGPLYGQGLRLGSGFRGGFQKRAPEISYQVAYWRWREGPVVWLEGITCSGSMEGGWILTEQCGILWMPVTPESRRQVRIQEQGLRESQG